jgi:hypothetical protein
MVIFIMINLKTLLLSSILAFSLSACKNTSEDIDNSLYTNYSPDLTSCDLKITKDNYKNIYLNKKSVIILNPFIKDACLPISFKYQDLSLISKVSSLTDFKYHNVMTKYSIRNDKKQHKNQSLVSWIHQDSFLQYMIYDHSSLNHLFFTEWANNSLLFKNYEEFFFLHELFHADFFQMNKSIHSKRKEFLADIGAIIAFASFNNLDHSQLKAFSSAVFKIRKDSIKKTGKKRSHIDVSLWQNFLLQIENDKSLFQFDNFQDIKKQSLKYI